MGTVIMGTVTPPLSVRGDTILTIPTHALPMGFMGRAGSSGVSSSARGRGITAPGVAAAMAGVDITAAIAVGWAIAAAQVTVAALDTLALVTALTAARLVMPAADTHSQAPALDTRW